MALVVDGLGSLGHELLKVGNRLGEDGPGFARALEVNQKITQVVLGHGEIVSILTD